MLCICQMNNTLISARYNVTFFLMDNCRGGWQNNGFNVKSLSGLCRALCDTKDCGKLSQEQFALAFHFITQKLTQGIDPPQVLTPTMIPPSERATLQKVKLLGLLQILWTERKAYENDCHYDLERVCSDITVLFSQEM